MLMGGGEGVELDTTLTQAGKAADAKTVGDKIKEIPTQFKTINGQEITGSGDLNVFEGSTDAQWTNKLIGKRISILGDSISTFNGYSYPGNRCRYPQSDLLTDVNKTYWKRLIDTTGMVLGISETWAGSRVSWDGSTESGDIGKDKHIASITRIKHLGENGNPDIILVYAGTNDAGNKVTIGTLDTTTDVKGLNEDAIKTLPVSDFASAFRTMILRLQYYYPEAKIIVLNLTYSSTYYNNPTLVKYSNIISECCEYFGVECVDLRKCGMNPVKISSYLPDGIHPNATGMELMYRQIYNKIINTCFTPSAVADVKYLVTYKYVNSNNYAIKSETYEYVPDGTKLELSTSNAPLISGYNISKVEPSGSVTVSSNMIVTYTYDEIQGQTYYTVTTKYVNEESSTIKSNDVQRLVKGTSLTISISDAPEIEGYTPLSVNPTGEITINDNTVITYTYKVIEQQLGTKWYITQSDDVTATNRANLFNGGWAWNDNDQALIRGKKINRIKLSPSATGALNFYKRNISTKQHTLVATINTEEKATAIQQNYSLDTPIEFGDGEMLVVGEANTKGGFYFATQGTGFISKVHAGENLPIVTPNICLCINLGYSES